MSCRVPRFRLSISPSIGASLWPACIVTSTTERILHCWSSTGRRELFPADAVELVAWIRDQKMTPILAHPERFSYLTAEPELLKPMVDAGAWIQITVDSLLGNLGPRRKWPAR